MAEIKDQMCNGNAEHFKPTMLPDTAITCCNATLHRSKNFSTFYQLFGREHQVELIFENAFPEH